ncbi:hypothetical protein KAX17_13075, partial [Candidatus Bipolaricaulota bacterium]|nr:hypothetical protein [Candidatus Bipolaricaulota bacterium]
YNHDDEQSDKDPLHDTRLVDDRAIAVVPCPIRDAHLTDSQNRHTSSVIDGNRIPFIRRQ